MLQHKSWIGNIYKSIPLVATACPLFQPSFILFLG